MPEWLELFNEKGRITGKEVREIMRNQIMLDFVGHYKEWHNSK